MLELAAGVVSLAAELFALVDDPNGEPLFEFGVLRFQRVAATPTPATSTNKIIKNGRNRFIQVKNVPRRAAFRDRRRLPRVS